jgi:hypothetical protein
MMTSPLQAANCPTSSDTHNARSVTIIYSFTCIIIGRGSDRVIGLIWSRARLVLFLSGKSRVIRFKRTRDRNGMLDLYYRGVWISYY